MANRLVQWSAALPDVWHGDASVTLAQWLARLLLAVAAISFAAGAGVGDPAVPPCAFQRAQAGLALRAARIRIGTQPRWETIHNKAQKERYIQVNNAEAAASAAAQGKPRPPGRISR